jgi:hypothetical protein
MTLPFRRRHNDAEASHDRARALISTGFVEPLGEAETTWLASHLERCPDCRAEQDAYAADRAMLRELRERMPEPPRDLWARTAAAIQSKSAPRRVLLAPSRFPVAALSAALVVLVVVGTTLLTDRGGIPTLPPPSGSLVAHLPSPPGATPIALTTAERLTWLEAGSDGSFALVFATVDHACRGADPECAPLADGSPEPLRLSAPPQALVLSPGNDQVAVVGSAAETTGSVTIVDVPTPRPSGSTAPSVPPATIPASPSASESTTPEIGHVIVRGVVVVGSVSYSSDGEWLAFSARPRDGSRGADLYVWHVGDADARKVTDDGATYFAGWYGNQIVASRVKVAALVPVDGSPGPADGSPPPTDASPQPSDEPETVLPIGAGIPESFLLDPESGARARFRGLNIWLPSIDPTGRFVTYWAGTLEPEDPTVTMPVDPGTVTGWRPAAGNLVLDGWQSPLQPSPDVSGSGAPSTTEPSAGPSSSPASEPSAPAAHESDGDLAAADGSSPKPPTAADGGPLSRAEGPAGTPLVLAEGPIAEFDAHFDPTGSRLAVWVIDSADAKVGRLWLVVLDPATGAVDPTLNPMGAPGVQAMRGFSIESGRLGWVTPAGQDGQPNSVQVLAWQGDDFGQVKSLPGGSLQIVR